MDNIPNNEDRLNSLESDIKTLVKTVNSVVGAVDKTNLNVAHIEKNVGAINHQLNKVTNKEFNWGNFLMAIGLLGAFWAAAIKPLEQNDNINADDIKLLEQHKTKMLETRFTNAHGEKMDIAHKDQMERMVNDYKHEIQVLRVELKDLTKMVIQHQIGESKH